jgi:hypothetical protein
MELKMDLLNHSDINVRLSQLEILMKSMEKPASGGNVNNHIHTFYSFSPYSPAKAVYMAVRSGLETAGIMDHDSVAGCREFIKAGEIAGIQTTVGAELRVSMENTPFSEKRINNPDQTGIAYAAMHAIPHQNIEKAEEFLAPYRKIRNERNKKMVKKLSGVLNMEIDFEKDVLPRSKYHEGGSVTERHILFAAAAKILENYDVMDFLTKNNIAVSDKIKGYLLDKENPFRQYDLLGVLKSSLVESFYINAKEECPRVTDYIKFCNDAGAISAYAYLGDVGESVTGDKKPQKFEDDYIEELFAHLKNFGFDGVTYMPSRNSLEQLLKVKDLCKKYDLMEISGEDINSPRQSFVCEALKNPVFGNLIDSTYRLIKHERGMR